MTEHCLFKTAVRNILKSFSVQILSLFLFKWVNFTRWLLLLPYTSSSLNVVNASPGIKCSKMNSFKRSLFIVEISADGTTTVNWRSKPKRVIKKMEQVYWTTFVECVEWSSFFVSKMKWLLVLYSMAPNFSCHYVIIIEW